jgi:SNF2 family DNA or RNA helicase
MASPKLWVPEHISGYENREYQEFGTQFLKGIRRAMLYDDPGLGKTPQAIKAAETPVLVVAPRYLVGQWRDAILREHEDAVIAFPDGSRKLRDKELNKKADWTIVNYEMVKSYDMPTGIRTYINDESHHVRNRRATHSRAVHAMETEDKTTRVYHLTATPFWKTVDDIWHQVDILYPGVLPPYREFIKLYCMSLKSPWGPKVVGIRPRMKADLKRLLAPIMLGRTYKDVGRFLPSIIESYVKIPLTPPLQVIYNHLVTEFSIRWSNEEEQKKLIFQPTTVLHALRQVTAKIKFDAVKHIIEDNNDKPSVIGFWYKDHAQVMFDSLKPNSAVLCTGEIDPVERQRRAMWAQDNGKHVVATESSLSEGINLSKYRLFISGEEHYVPGKNHQFISRVVRDRNDNGKDQEPVRVFYVQAERTVDESIHKTARSRKQTNQAVRDMLSETLKARK